MSVSACATGISLLSCKGVLFSIGERAPDLQRMRSTNKLSSKFEIVRRIVDMDVLEFGKISKWI